MIRPALFVALVFGSAAPALASGGQFTLADGHGYVSACSGSTLGTFEQQGGRTGVTGPDRTCGEATSAGTGAGSHATFTTSSTGPIPSGAGAFTNTATGTASVGTIHLSADNHASTATYFAGAQANGGWNDHVRLDPTNPAQVGTAGIWVFAIHVEGTLAALGNYGASSGFGVEIFKNHQGLLDLGAGIPSYDVFVAKNPPLIPSFNIEYGEFEQKLWSYTWGDHNQDVTKVISEDVMFAVPFIYGTDFTLGVFGQVSAGESSASVYFGDNHASADFANTISWGGKGYVLDASGHGPSSTNFTISSLSNFNYAGGAVPEPASWMLMLAGFGAVGVAARRHRVAVAA